MSVLSCLDRLLSQGKLTKEQHQQAKDAYNNVYERALPFMGAGSAEARAAVETARIMEETAKANDLRLLKNSAATQQAWDRIQNHDAGPMPGFNSLMAFDPHGSRGENIESLGKGIETQAAKLMNFLVEKYGTKAAGLKAGTFEIRNAIRQTFYDTGDSTAQAFGKMWSDLTGKEGHFVTEAQRAGKVFTPAEDWGRPQFWETYRARQFNTQTFSRDIRAEMSGGGLKLHDPSTGLEAAPSRAEEILAGSANKIVMDLPWEGGVGGSFTPDMRVFRFTSDRAGADSYLRLMDKYGPGQGGYVGMLQGHVARMSRDLAAMKILGPDWQRNLEGLYKKSVELNRSGKWDAPPPPLTINGVRDKTGKLAMSLVESEHASQRLMDYMIGKGTRVANQNVAAFFNGYRGFTTARKMGSGIVTAFFQDPVNMVAEANWMGMNSGRMLGNLYAQMFGATKLTDGELARMGIILKGSIDEGIGVKRFADQWLGEKLGSRMGSLVVRASFLDRWDQMMRSTFQQEFLSAIGDRAGQSFDKLEGPFKDHFLTPTGITEDEWKVLSDPANHFRLGPAGILDLDKLLGPNEPLRQKMLSAMFDERNYAYLVGGSAYTRAAKGAAGTIPGEILRGAFQFKTWPVSLLTTWGTRAINQAGGLGPKAALGAKIALPLAMMGGVTLMAKSLLNGKDLPDIKDPWFWVEASLQGGVAGLASDYARDFFSRDSTSLIESLFGPWTSDVRDIQQLVSKSARSAVGETDNWGGALARVVRDAPPGGTMWFVRLLFQRMAIDQFQKMIDPHAQKAFDRQRDRSIKLRNQDFWWRPGETAPTREPQMSAH